MIIPTGKKKNVNIRHTGPWWRLGSGVWGWSRYGWHVLGSGPRGAAALGWYNQQVTLYDICCLGPPSIKLIWILAPKCFHPPSTK